MKIKYFQRVTIIVLLGIFQSLLAEGNQPGVTPDQPGVQEPPDSPIDMFMVPLAMIAIVFIIMYAAKVVKTKSVK